MLIFCTLHEFGHIIAGLILKLKPENLEILPYGLSISFKLNPDDINKKIKKRKFIRNKENDCCIIRTNAKFGISKKAFKASLTKLLAEDKIVLEENSIRVK